METRALVLRVIPYSDRMKIIRCLTDDAGLQSYAISISGKAKTGNVAQTGRFISIQVQNKNSTLSRAKDVRLDPAMNQLQLNPTLLPVWFFTLELVSKSAAEDLHIPGLRQTIDRYYTLLCTDQITSSPLIPLISLTAVLGTEDLQTLAAPKSTLESLQNLGYTISLDDEASTDELLRTMLHRFQNHFNIHSLDSLELVS